MKSDELKIGNYVFDNLGGVLKIKSISHESDLSHLKPIKITEDWLIKLGFEKQMTWTYKIHLTGNKELVYYLGEKGWSVGNKNYSDFSCEYVHQLQNVYNAITNSELSIKGGNK
jgi:hypothetical protein